MPVTYVGRFLPSRHPEVGEILRPARTFFVVVLSYLLAQVFLTTAAEHPRAPPERRAKPRQLLARSIGDGPDVPDVVFCDRSPVGVGDSKGSTVLPPAHD